MRKADPDGVSTFSVKEVLPLNGVSNTPPSAPLNVVKAFDPVNSVCLKEPDTCFTLLLLRAFGFTIIPTEALVLAGIKSLIDLNKVLSKNLIRFTKSFISYLELVEV